MTRLARIYLFALIGVPALFAGCSDDTTTPPENVSNGTAEDAGDRDAEQVPTDMGASDLGRTDQGAGEDMSGDVGRSDTDMASDQGPDLPSNPRVEALVAEIDGETIEVESMAAMQWRIIVRGARAEDLREILEESGDIEPDEWASYQALFSSSALLSCAWDLDDTVCFVEVDRQLTDGRSDVESTRAVSFEGEVSPELEGRIDALPQAIRYERHFACIVTDLGATPTIDNTVCFLRKKIFGYLEETNLSEQMLMAANESPKNILVDNAGLSENVAQNIVDQRAIDSYDSLDEFSAVTGVDQVVFDKLANWLQ